jgi:uncharacterized membrane protein
MSKQLDLMAAVYAAPERAETILNMLQAMHRATNITLADAAMVTRDQDGKLQIKETREVTAGKGAKRGALAAGVFGLIFPPSLIASAIVGGAAGGVWGKLRDTGIKTGDMKEIADALEPGQAMVFALSEPASVPEIERAMEGWNGRLVRHGFTAEDTAAIEQAAETEAPKDA